MKAVKVGCMYSYFITQ